MNAGGLNRGGKLWEFVVPEATRPAHHALLGYPPPTACLPKLLSTNEAHKSKKYMLALIVINQMGKRSQALSSRQRAPPSVYPSASGVRAPPHVGKSRVKGCVAVFGRRPWAGARQGRRQREDGLRRVEWSAAALGARSSGHGTPLRWEAPLVRQ